MNISAVVDNTTFVLLVSGEMMTVSLLFWRRRYRRLPAFTVYIAYALFAVIYLRISEAVASERVYWVAFYALEAVQRLLEVILAWELARQVHRAAQERVARGSILLAWFCIAFCICFGLFFGRIVRFDHIKEMTQLFLHLDFSSGVMIALFYLLLLFYARLLRVPLKEPPVSVLLVLTVYFMGWVWTRIFQEHGQQIGCECDAFEWGELMVSMLWSVAIWSLAVVSWKMERYSISPEVLTLHHDRQEKLA